MLNHGYEYIVYFGSPTVVMSEREACLRGAKRIRWSVGIGRGCSGTMCGWSDNLDLKNGTILPFFQDLPLTVTVGANQESSTAAPRRRHAGYRRESATPAPTIDAGARYRPPLAPRPQSPGCNVGGCAA
ncbi:hypothetical protein J6590_035126 [Homalodisca vitripennis]|nr:hypothetical protein J6590_035126 [Homalodisca vitripennis]